MWEFFATVRAAMAAIFRMEQMMSAQADEFRAMTAQMGKVREEIAGLKAKAATLEERLANAELPDDARAALKDLQDGIAAADAEIPDAPVEPPV